MMNDVIDRSRLDRICAGQREMAYELIALLLESCGDLSASLQNASNTRNRVMACEHAHALRGNAANVGAIRLEDSVRTLETLLKAGDQNNWRAVDVQIATVLASVEELHTYAAQEKAALQ